MSARLRVIEDLDTAGRVVFNGFSRRQIDPKRIPRSQFPFGVCVPGVKRTWSQEPFKADICQELFYFYGFALLEDLEPETENEAVSNLMRDLRLALMTDVQRGDHPTEPGGKNARRTWLDEGATEEGALTTTEVGGAIGAFRQGVWVEYEDTL